MPRSVSSSQLGVLRLRDCTQQPRVRQISPAYWWAEQALLFILLS
jgi:hypothetical protein